MAKLIISDNHGEAPPVQKPVEATGQDGITKNAASFNDAQLDSLKNNGIVAPSSNSASNEP